MKKETLLIVVVALLVVIIGGNLAHCISEGTVELPPGGAPPGIGSPVDYRQRIAEGKKAVAMDPKNHAQWVQLGNDYFDSDQPALAVNAYEMALEFDPNDTEVLTDQGISCRKIGWYDKAVEDFEKALKIDPNNEQSLVNLGIVYALDLKQPDRALKAWNRFLELNPTCVAARKVRLWVEELKANPAAFAEKK